MGFMKWNKNTRMNGEKQKEIFLEKQKMKHFRWIEKFTIKCVTVASKAKIPFWDEWFGFGSSLWLSVGSLAKE